MQKTVQKITSAKDGSAGYIERFSKLTPRVFFETQGGIEWTSLDDFNRDGARARRYFTSAIKSLDVIS